MIDSILDQSVVSMKCGLNAYLRLMKRNNELLMEAIPSRELNDKEQAIKDDAKTIHTSLCRINKNLIDESVMFGHSIQTPATNGTELPDIIKNNDTKMFSYIFENDKEVSDHFISYLYLIQRDLLEFKWNVYDYGTNFDEECDTILAMLDKLAESVRNRNYNVKFMQMIDTIARNKMEDVKCIQPTQQ